MIIGPRHGWQVPPRCASSQLHSPLEQWLLACLLLHYTRLSETVFWVLYFQHFLMCQAQDPKPQRKQARVNTEENKGPANPQLCEFTAQLMSTPSYISASPTMLRSQLREARLSFSSCAGCDLFWQRSMPRFHSSAALDTSTFLKTQQI